MDSILPERRDDELPSPIGEGGHPAWAAPYAGFQLPAEETASVPQFGALLEDPEIAGYLKQGGEGGWTARRTRRLLLGFLIFVGACAAMYVSRRWTMFHTYRPPPVVETAKPMPFTEFVPLLFRERIRSINADIASGDKWPSVFDKLAALVNDIDAGGIDAPADIRLWARSETLVAMASREVPPKAFAESYPDRVFRGLAHSLPDADAVLPFRAEAAYVQLLNAAPRNPENTREADRKLLIAVELLRRDHGKRLDSSRDLLAIEAKAHIALFPPEYPANNRDLNYNWRRASHAVNRLYTMHGTSDPQTRSLDRKRWEAVSRYFEFTLLTLDYGRLGRLKTVSLDGEEYTQEQVNGILKNL